MTSDLSSPTPPARLPIVLAITGASGAVYAVRLLTSLLCKRVPVMLTISDSGKAVIRHELDVVAADEPDSIQALLEAADNFLSVPSDAPVRAAGAAQLLHGDGLRIYNVRDYFTPIASGSFLTGGMVVCPCSGSTLSGIAHAASNNLIQRAADVHLKERRKLVVVPRETPLNTFQLENMLRLSQQGVTVLPAAPGWYHEPGSLLDLVDFVVARILDQLTIENSHMPRWAAQESEDGK